MVTGAPPSLTWVAAVHAAPEDVTPWRSGSPTKTRGVTEAAGTVGASLGYGWVRLDNHHLAQRRRRRLQQWRAVVPGLRRGGQRRREGT